MTAPLLDRRSSSQSKRRANAVESFRSAAATIGPITPGLALFALTRGQFSMIDAILHTLDQLGPSRVSVWTWTVADYEINAFTQLRQDGRITDGTLVIDGGARKKNHDLITDWRNSFGADSVRYILNHAKIATVDNGTLRVLLRGSMNLNNNPRFEQFDLTEGGPDFDLVRQVESELPILPDSVSEAKLYAASKVSDAFDQQELAVFRGVRTWAK